jgi:hypothetical protein
MSFISDYKKLLCNGEYPSLNYSMQLRILSIDAAAGSVLPAGC